MDIHFKKSKVKADVKPNNYDINFGVQKVKVVGTLQTKTAIPSRQEQTIQADDGYDALSKVVVEPIPKNYGLITYNGGVIKVS